ncbi:MULTISPECIES: hypothetical protein [unclassified Dyella]|uniref:hypothetical protein n=1 Tax=unclassified Dyella TaxID=2634549 RepID=UPI0011AEDF47|nr:MULTISPECIES: hypothetical protein [unclassified Dyella]MDR3443975.1 hypothetical protein [Dyella sp.]
MTDVHSRPRRTLPLLAKALLPTVLLVAMVAASSLALSDGWVRLGDDVSPAQAQMRLEAFHTLDSLVASKVAPADIERALDGMQLSTVARQSLRGELQPETATLATALDASPTTPAIQPAPQPQTSTQRPQLVWIRLWDTDAEDGDVVRIDSGGYSRTVRLTKHGDTFAVPVSPDGMVRVTGIKDGDGGGITVGLASGSSQAVFPIMSEGQVLGLRVRME